MLHIGDRRPPIGPRRVRHLAAMSWGAAPAQALCPMADAAAMPHSTHPLPGRAPEDSASGSVIVHVENDDNGADAPVVHTAIKIAQREGRPLVLVDRSGEGLLGNTFYDDMRADDASKPRKDQVFGPDIARREGRATLAGHIEAAREDGVDAGGWFPTDAGLDGIRAAVERFDGRVVVIPESDREPNLSDRLFGTTAEDLERLGVRLIFVDRADAG